ncbi:uncharacterized protein C11orf97 homolog [Haliotis cracherodii]|uniref:uncharacterized protein C11orf97 homolog n=1 Tax=Haliotis cracherodii TaxID=6455 RepID=UPI0039E761F9
MRKDGDSQPPGGAKKFLYTGPKSKEHAEEDQMNFAPRKNSSSSPSAIDLDGVWSIKRNVGIGTAQQDKLNLNANKSFYSRHGGMKDSSASCSMPGAVGDGMWTPGRRGYSYSPGANVKDTRGQSSQGQTNKWANDDHDF